MNMFSGPKPMGGGPRISSLQFLDQLCVPMSQQCYEVPDIALRFPQSSK